MHGKGIYYYVNGEVYEGEWKNGKMERKGIYYYLNGDMEKELIIILMEIEKWEIILMVNQKESMLL